MQRSVGNRGWILFCLLSLYILWGSTFMAIRVSVATMPPFLVGGFRHFLGGLLLFAFVLRQVRGLSTREVLGALFVGMLTAGVANGSLIYLGQSVPSAVAALAFTLMPPSLLLLNWIAFDRVRPATLDLFAIGIGMIGTSLLISGGRSLGGHAFTMLEVVLLVGYPFVWALGSLIGRRISMPKSILMSSALQMIGGGASLFAVGTLAGNWATLSQQSVSWASIFGILYLFFFGSFVGYTLYAYLIKTVDPSLAGSYAFASPVVALAIGYLFGERLFSAAEVWGACLALVSIGLIVLRQIRDRRIQG